MKKFLDKIKTGKGVTDSGYGDSITLEGYGGSGGSRGNTLNYYTYADNAIVNYNNFTEAKPIKYPSYPNTYPRYNRDKWEKWVDYPTDAKYENYEQYSMIGLTLEDAGCRYASFQKMDCGLLIDSEEYKKDSGLYAKAHYKHHTEKHDKPSKLYKIRSGLCIGCTTIKLIKFIEEYNSDTENCEIKYEDTYILQLECGMVVPATLHSADFRQIELIHSDVHDFEINERFFMPQQVESIIKRYKESEKPNKIRKVII